MFSVFPNVDLVFDEVLRRHVGQRSDASATGLHISL